MCEAVKELHHTEVEGKNETKQGDAVAKSKNCNHLIVKLFLPYPCKFCISKISTLVISILIISILVIRTLIHILLISIDFTLTGSRFGWYKC